MDRRNIYHTIEYLISSIEDSSLSNILEDMSIVSLDPYQSKDPKLFEEFLKVMPVSSIDEEEYGYVYASRFYEFLTERYEALKTHPLDKEQYVYHAMVNEMNVDYMILRWTVLMYSVIYGKFKPLKDFYKTTDPLMEDGSVGVLFNDFGANFLAKPVPYKNGYSYTASWLFGMGQVAQTLMTRIGETYWDSLYLHYEEIVSPLASKELIRMFLKKRQVFTSGGDIKDFLPIFISFGYEISFNFENHVYSISFPFDGYEMKDIQTFVDGEKLKSFDFLDDLFKDGLIEGRKLLDVFDECTNVTIVA